MPRYQNFDTALYSKKFETIFSTLNFEPTTSLAGFHMDEKNYYLIYTFT